MIGYEQKSKVLDYAASERRRNENAEAAGNSGENVARALHNSFRRLRRGEFAANPVAILGADRRLRGNLLNKEAVGRSRGDAPCGRVRLIQVALFFEVRHDVADRRRTQRFDMAARDAAR